jgi:glycogen(starch) synthase
MVEGSPDGLELAVLAWEFPPRLVGGLGTYAQEISAQFVRMGHDVTVFTLNEGFLPTRDVWSGVDVHRPLLVDIIEAFPQSTVEDIRKRYHNVGFLAHILCYNISSSLSLVYDLARKEHRKFDIVVSHDWLSIIGGMITRRELDIPLVFHVHSTEQGRSLGGGSQYITELEQKGGLTADRVVTVSNPMRDELVAHGFPESQLRVCYNGVDSTKYDPATVSHEDVKRLRASFGVGEDEKMILFLGRLSAVKGVDRLVMAMPSILEKVPKAKLVIVGVGDMQRHLLELISRYGLQKTVKTRFEWISEKERILHYAACDVCAIPSLYEPFGIVCLEAMSMGKPVVIGARGTSGMRETVINTGPDRCGYHVNAFEPTDIAWGIENVLSDEKDAKTMGVNGRRRVIQFYTWEIAARNTIRIYEEVLESRPG